ncbi:DUF881 domain-containing protein [Bacillus sp. FJAT-42376]|uniref:DUF881 domain-containing protein n=1 Tax=Bacillus sp. FJAT-42376 TaxID=2014076 RepID=UPI001F14A340|nr:DUF881 domain-containing protein [Bacillus sp. FJAT-42376]
MSGRKKIAGYTLIMGLFGFMLSVQFLSIKEPVTRDTRDIWEIRSELKQEQKQQSELLKEITKYDQLVNTYESNEETAREDALEKTRDELKVQAGLTEVKGDGLVLHLEPLFTKEIIGESTISVSPDLLRKLINELNTYDAEHISVNGHRVVSTTVIRDINGVTKMDGYPLDSLPIEIKVIAENANKLSDRVKASGTHDLFAVDNIKLTDEEPRKNIVIPGSDKKIRIGELKPYEGSKGGEN